MVDAGGDFMIALVNKITIKKICDNIGVESRYIAEKVGCNPPSKADEWLDVNSVVRPTFNQAKSLAKHLKIPFAGLYMNPEDVPIKENPKVTSRRTLTSENAESESAVNIAIADLIRTRDFYLSSMSDLNEEVVRFDVKIRDDENPKNFAKKIREVFQIDLSEQFKISSKRQFYLYIRERLEKHGVFIHGFSGVEVEVLRGVAIYSSDMPIIGINNDDSYPAKTFTMIHELVHLLKRHSSLCNIFYNDFTKQKEEVFCNAVAGEVLVPREALIIKLQKYVEKHNLSVAEIEDLANEFNISKEVIVRRLLDLNQINKNAYDSYIDEFRRNYEADSIRRKTEREIAKSEGRRSSIPRDMVRESIDKNSRSLCLALFSGYAESLFSKQDVCSYLGIKNKHADKFIVEVSKWNN